MLKCHVDHVSHAAVAAAVGAGTMVCGVVIVLGVTTLIRKCVHLIKLEIRMVRHNSPNCNRNSNCIEWSKIHRAYQLFVLLNCDSIRISVSGRHIHEKRASTSSARESFSNILLNGEARASQALVDWLLLFLLLLLYSPLKYHPDFSVITWVT